MIPISNSPVSSLRYWCHVHRRIADFRDRHPDRVLILSFDQFCTEPETVARRLLDFSSIEAGESILERVVTGVKALIDQEAP